MKSKEIIISHNFIPLTILGITDWGYYLKFGDHSIPFGKEEAKKLIEAIKQNP